MARTHAQQTGSGQKGAPARNRCSRGMLLSPLLSARFVSVLSLTREEQDESQDRRIEVMGLTGQRAILGFFVI